MAYDDLKIILYPDPRLKKAAAPVTIFDDSLKELAQRMFQLMREHKGVGLAGPQVAQNLRIFVMNSTGELQDDRVYVNPVLIDAEDEEEGEEGCLSIPELHVNIFRSKSIRMKAQDLSGQPIEEPASGYIARIWQHETDHLNGVLLTDRMGPVAKLTHRKLLKELEDKYATEHPAVAKRR
jgi:peptide deformylase